MPRKKKSDQIPKVFLHCGWVNCCHRVKVEDFLDFRSHVEQHIKEILPNYQNRSSNDAIPDDFSCRWDNCAWDTPENANEVIRHVLFHAFHTKLKALGTRKQMEQNLSECSLDSQAQNQVPDVQKPFLCEWDGCDMEMNCPHLFYQHVESHVMSVDRQESQDDGEDKGCYVACGWTGCKSTARNHHKLKEHCRTHTHERVYACSLCGGMFASMSKLIDHLTRQNQSDFQCFQCSHCLKYCGSQRILRDHMRHHVNNIKCNLCDMTCPNPSALKQHMKFRHSDDRPYECDLCEASWKTLSDLRRHRESHNAVLSYECSVEGCTFSARSMQTLKRHFKVQHQGEELTKYECHICGLRYTRGAGLTQHLKTKHKFRWPSGHPRFRYKEHEDGIWRLQTVRFESLQLSQQFNEDQEQVIEEGTEEEQYNPEDCSSDHSHYQPIDSPVVASLGGPVYDHSYTDVLSNNTCTSIGNKEYLAQDDLNTRNYTSTVNREDFAQDDHTTRNYASTANIVDQNNHNIRNYTSTVNREHFAQDESMGNSASTVNREHFFQDGHNTRNHFSTVNREHFAHDKHMGNCIPEVNREHLAQDVTSTTVDLTSLTSQPSLSSNAIVQFLTSSSQGNNAQGSRRNASSVDKSSLRKKRGSKRKQPYERRPESPSFDVPETLLALQQVASRLAANND